MPAVLRHARPGALALFLVLGAALAALAVFYQHPEHRPAGALVAAAGLVAGLALSLWLPARRRDRTVMERLNDAAFLVVLAAASLLVVGVARPFGAAVPGLVGGLVAGLPLRGALRG